MILVSRRREEGLESNWLSAGLSFKHMTKHWQSHRRVILSLIFFHFEHKHKEGLLLHGMGIGIYRRAMFTSCEWLYRGTN